MKELCSLCALLIFLLFSISYAGEEEEYNTLDDLLAYLDVQGVEYEVHFDIDREPTEEDVFYTNIAGYLNLDADGYLDCDLEWVYELGVPREAVHSYHDPYGSGYDFRYDGCVYGDACVWQFWGFEDTVEGAGPSFTTLWLDEDLESGICETWDVFKIRYKVHDFFWTYLWIGGKWVYVKIYYDPQYCYTPNICTFDW